MQVYVTSSFKRALKPLLKKYPSLKSDLSKLERQLLANPQIGIYLGSQVYKIRLNISSKNRGKSSGARVIYFLSMYNMHGKTDNHSDGAIYLLMVYDKSEIVNINNNEILKLVDRFILDQK